MRNVDSLTQREKEVMDLVAAGLTNRAISEKLSLSKRTVEGHLYDAFNKFGVHSRIAAINAMRSEGAEIWGNDLRACPFCGGVAKYLGNVARGNEIKVVCTDCGTETKVFGSFGEAAKTWNRRVHDE